MAGGKNNYLENKVLDYVLSGATFAPATVYVGLLTTLPDDASTSGSLSPGVECTGGSYARVAVTNNATNWPAASGGSKSNGTAITFPAATAGWGTVVGWIIADVASGAGNILYWGPVSPSHAVLNTETAQFVAGTLIVTED